ncbi:hypothetical protein MRX96_038639 [Rhipicephalus microplus]
MGLSLVRTSGAPGVVRPYTAYAAVVLALISLSKLRNDTHSVPYGASASHGYSDIGDVASRRRCAALDIECPEAENRRYLSEELQRSEAP